MTLAFQLAVFALIATSSILLIDVPVVFASPDGWSSNKNFCFYGTSLWIGLVFLVGILNFIFSSLEPIRSSPKTEMTPRIFLGCEIQ